MLPKAALAAYMQYMGQVMHAGAGTQGTGIAV
jgi:hypothetical protein